MVSLAAGAREFLCTPKEFRDALTGLRVPIMTLPTGHEVFSLFALEQTLFANLLPGEPNFLFTKSPPNRRSPHPELEIAALAYSVCDREQLMRRVKSVGEQLRKTIRAREKGAKAVDKG